MPFILRKEEIKTENRGLCRLMAARYQTFDAALETIRYPISESAMRRLTVDHLLHALNKRVFSNI